LTKLTHAMQFGTISSGLLAASPKIIKRCRWSELMNYCKCADPRLTL